MHAALILDWLGFHMRQHGAEYSSKPWVAQIRGFHVKFDLDRVFVLGKLDLTQANKRGTRGVRLAFYLPAGLYEVCRYAKGNRDRIVETREFILSQDGATSIIGRHKVNQWLTEQSRGWASPSSTQPAIG